MLITSLLLSFAPVVAVPLGAAPVQPAAHWVCAVNRISSASIPSGRITSDGLQAGQLPAETRFVAHIDVRTLLDSSLWNDFIKGNMGTDDLEELNQLKTELGLDPFQDIHSVTVFGSSPDEDSAAVMVRGTKALETALRRLENQDGCTRFEVEGLNLHVFEQGSETTYIYSHDSGRSQERTVILSPSRTELLRAALVLRGGRQSLASLQAEGSQASGLDLNAPAGSLLHVAFAGGLPGIDGDDPVSGLLKMARGGVFSLGESRGDLTLHLGLVTESENKAMDMADGVDGLKSFANMLLQGVDDVPAEVRTLIRSFRVNNEGSTVFVDFNYPLKKLFDLAQEGQLDFGR